LLRHRFTGAWPPPALWAQFPNWEHALDEEDVPDQDETTLRPASEQRFVIDYGFSAADVDLANGSRLPALLSMNGGVDGLTAFASDADGWSVTRLGVPPRWVCTVQDWLPEKQRSPSVTFSDPSVFPLRVRSRLPTKESGKPMDFTLSSDGDVSEAG
jgi:hypothetical protein